MNTKTDFCLNFTKVSFVILILLLKTNIDIFEKKEYYILSCDDRERCLIFSCRELSFGVRQQGKLVLNHP